MSNIDIDPDRIELYFGNDSIAPGGYVWIFPKGERTANVGIGVRKPFAKKTAKEYLDDFIASRESLRRGSIIEVNSGAVPVGGLLKNMVAQGFIVVGDAAHQVNPIHGGGISEAFVGGKIAGEIAKEAKDKSDYSEDFLSEYNNRWWEERGNKLQKVCVLREVAERLSDEELNWLADRLTGENLIDFSKSNSLGILAKLLMKKPRLITLARKLL
jgi:digeranylgeranylglycerophospholipid reductase